MHDDKAFAQPKNQPATQGKTAVPADIKLLADIVIQLNILKKNLSIYPPGHHLITQSTTAAIDALGKSFEKTPLVTIGAVKESLFLGGRRIETKNPAFRDFATTLNRLGITALYLSHGIDGDELLRLQRLLSVRPEDIRSQADMEALAEAAQLSHVKIKLMDYSIFRATEEAVIKTRRDADQHLSGADLWERFTKGLHPGGNANGLGGAGSTILQAFAGGSTVVLEGGADGSLQAGSEYDEEADDEVIPSTMIARMLNDGTVSIEKALQTYNEVLTQFSSIGFQRTVLGRESLRFFKKMNNILRDLLPGNRVNFLKTALRHMSLMADQESMEELLKCFPVELAAEMLGVADHEGRQLSPALQKLMLKFSAIQEGMTDQELLTSARPSGVGADFMETLDILPKREDYEKHMPTDYSQQLTDMNEKPAAIKPPEEFSLSEHLESLNKQNLDMHIGRVLIALMDQDIDSSAYHDFTQKVIELVPALLDAGSFRPMFIIFSTLRQHAEKKTQPDVRTLAKMAIQIFYEPAFVRQMVSHLVETGADASVDLISLLKETGQQVIPELIDLYASEQSSEGSERLFELLCSFGHQVVDAAVIRLNHRNFFYVRNLLRLIRAIADESVVESIRPLLRQANRDLRVEVLETLLHFKDPVATSALRVQLQSKSMPDVSRAVLMIHKYRVTALAGELLKLIRIFIPFEQETLLNCMVLQALAALGDPAALPVLRKIAQARFTLMPGNLKKTKIALFESLALYPPGSTRELLTIGMRSGNEQIRQICSSITVEGR